MHKHQSACLRVVDLRFISGGSNHDAPAGREVKVADAEGCRLVNHISYAEVFQAVVSELFLLRNYQRCVKTACKLPYDPHVAPFNIIYFVLGLLKVQLCWVLFVHFILPELHFVANIDREGIPM